MEDVKNPEDTKRDSTSTQEKSCLAEKDLKQHEQKKRIMIKKKVKYILFLKEHGIMVANDATVEYLQYLINEQKRYGVSEDTISHLEHFPSSGIELFRRN